ncbi:MAG: class I SAM-dependent methyltransferase [Marinosulfonomonas sp.]
MNPRLSLAIEGGSVELPSDGRIAVFGAPADQDLSALPKDRVQVIQGYFPDHQAFAALGYSVGTAPEGAFSAAFVFLSRARTESRALLLQAQEITNGGIVVIDGQKTDGVDSMLKDCKSHGAVIGPVYAKAHGKIFSVHGGDFSDWRAAVAPKTVDGFLTAPGVFSADGIDKGSAALAAALPDTLKGRVADLGAGWGYLSSEILKRADVTECHLVEASHGALDCARQNLTDDRARFHWGDATAFQPDTPFDFVVTNPPFHTSRVADPALGRAFIQSAARILASRGTLWLVANRHLPYEAALADAFIEVEEITGDPSFKIFRASKPRRAKR